MAQRIAKQTTGGVSVWDVHVEVKSGDVDFPAGSQLRKWLAFMRDGKLGTDIPNTLKWKDSLRDLLKLFQDHFNDGSTILKHIKSLHYLKFSLVDKPNAKGEDATFFCFCTQFDDGAEDEQHYIDDMYQQYGALMEVVWHHCKGVVDLLAIPATLHDPPNASVPPRNEGFELHPDFLKLVDNSNVDRDGRLCFFNSNPHVTSENIKNWQADKLKLSKTSVVVGEARLARQQPNANPAKILSDLMLALDQLKV